MSMKAYIYPRPRPYMPGAYWSVQTIESDNWNPNQIWSSPKEFDTFEQADAYARSVTDEIRQYGVIR